MDAILTLGQYIFGAVLITARQLFVLTGPGLILALIMYIISDIIRSRTVILLGLKAAVYLTAIGIIVHELGHAIFALLFGHHIADFTPFCPDWQSGELGHVYHAYNPKSLPQVVGNFFVGIGPILLGAATISLSAALLVGSSVFAPLYAAEVTAATFASFDLVWAWLGAVWTGGLEVFRLLFAGSSLARWQLYLFLYLVFAVGSQMKLSMPDLKGAWKGLVVIVALLLGFNILTLWAGDYGTAVIVLLAGLYGFFYGYMIFAIILNAAIALLLLLLTALTGAMTRLR